jgi:hypothetical protein
MKKIKIYMVMLAFIPLSSCKKYLEKEPKVQTDIQTADQLEALINNAAGTSSLTSNNFPCDGTNSTAAFSTDDTEITTDLYKNNPATLTVDLLSYYVFDINQVVGATADAFWNGEYKKIFTVNVILENVDKVTGDQAQKNRIKADAYFIRAYCYWNLVNYYCQPYAAGNMQSKGLPLKKTTSYTESLKRATLQETYDFILADITQAQNLVASTDVQASLRWRISKRAIDAFLSRYYLFTGDYDKSLQNANSALTSAVAKLVDYNTIQAGIPEAYANPAVTLNYSILNNRNIVQILNWDEFFYTRVTYTSRQWFVPSNNLLALYDTTNDLRYKLFMIPNGGRRFGIVTPATFRYTVFYDGCFLPTGPTVAEVLLNKAEASARKGDVVTAMAAVNQLRAKRFKTYVALTATDQADALTKVLQERRRELPFSFRWWDIRRFSVNEDPSDDVVVTRNFFKLGVGTVDVNTIQTYTLPVKSSRYMVPINGVEINASQGQIEQNTY